MINDFIIDNMMSRRQSATISRFPETNHSAPYNIKVPVKLDITYKSVSEIFKAIKSKSKFLSIIESIAPILVYLAIFIFSNHLWLIYVGSFFRGIAQVIILASSYAMALILMPPRERGKLFSYYNATLYLSWGLASTLIAGPIE